MVEICHVISAFSITTSTPRKSSETKILTFLLQPIRHLFGRFDEDRLGGLGDIAT